MAIRRGRLLIDEKPYTKEIVAPGPAEIFKPSEKMWDLASEIDMIKGKEETISKSFFIAYAAAVHDQDDIRAAYLKVRTKFADATHVVCAYRLPGKNTHNMQDYVDDGEIGAGRVVLNVLKEERLMNIVVFMIRKYGGQHLGPSRFDIMRRVTMSAITNMRKKLEEYDKEQERKRTEEEQAAQRNREAEKDWQEWSQALEEEGWQQVTPKSSKTD